VNSAALLAAEARSLAIRPDRRLGANVCVAAAFVVREALEVALDSFWDRTVPGMPQVNMRAQLISLPFFLPDAILAADLRAAWNRLSEACHPDVYELPPTPAEIVSLTSTVDRLLAANTSTV
jgi:hypothetical protein